MGSPSRLNRTSSGIDDLLLPLLLGVAQRADELARTCPGGGSAKRDRETWLLAEAEYLSSGRPRRPAW